MRCLLLLAAAVLPAAAQPVLYAMASFADGYVVGGKLSRSGLLRRGPDGSWQHTGYNLPIFSAFLQDPLDPTSILLAAGNGLIRVKGDAWTILTGSDVTELRDVTTAAGAVYFAHTRGIRVTRDGGKTWSELSDGLRRKCVEAIRVAKDGGLIAGGENGIYRSGDGGGSWTLAGAAGFQVMRIESSPHDGCFLLAATQGGGLFASHDCGRTFENSGSIGVDRNIYDIAFDAGQAGRVAIGGFGPGVEVSTDNGKTWQRRSAGLPDFDVTTVAFDPAVRGRLYAGVHEKALYVSDDAGLTWRKDGLEGSHIVCLRFLPGVNR